MIPVLDGPWLSVDLGAPHRVLSWALNRPGHVTARHILWRQVRNADLPPGLDVRAWIEHALQARGQDDAVCLLTSRRIAAYTIGQGRDGDASADCVATVGLSNAERVGRRAPPRPHFGTINIAVRLSVPMGDTGLIEALSIATQARTAAVIDAGWRIETGIATGTGTDCIAVAAPLGTQDFAGLHTPVGAALGQAVYDATARGVADWIGEQQGEEQHG